MGQIKVTPCDIKGLYIIEPTVHGDNRGYFMETYNQKDMHEAGLDMVFVQDNQSCSTKGVLRGLHFQKEFLENKQLCSHKDFYLDDFDSIHNKWEIYLVHYKEKSYDKETLLVLLIR